MAKSQFHQTFEINNIIMTGYLTIEKYAKLLGYSRNEKKDNETRFELSKQF